MGNIFIILKSMHNEKGSDWLSFWHGNIQLSKKEIRITFSSKWFE